MDLVTMMCRENLKFLKSHTAGRFGPVEDRYIWDIMCSTNCRKADSLHQSAIKLSGCNCYALSTQPGDLYYNADRDGDFCLENTGRMLCEVMEVCENWKCDLWDFMCPRYNYNKKFIPLRGMGSCSVGAHFAALSTLAVFVAVYVAAQLLVM